MKNKLLTLSFIAILSIVCFPRPASASTYGSNAYGKCAYSTGCAPCPDTTTPSTTSTTPSESTSGTKQPNTVMLVEKSLHIPFDPDNTDYQEYLKWVAEGNTPLPAEE
jgi:hypothetical protein